MNIFVLASEVNLAKAVQITLSAFPDFRKLFFISNQTMDIEIVGREVDLAEAICIHFKDRLYAVLDQHDKAAERVQIVFEDINGPHHS